MSDTGHASADGVLHKPADDRRTPDLERELQHAPPDGQLHKLTSDPHSVFGLQQRAFSHENPLHFGVVIQSLGYVNWYRVQLDRGQTFCPACMGDGSGFVPPGIVTTSPLPPRTEVVVYKPKSAPYGIILAALPYGIADGNYSIGTIFQQGGNTGIKRETAGKRPFQAFFRAGGVRDWSVHRPVDGTSMEWGKISATNIAFLLDNFQTFLRVHEACGLFLNLFDGYTRLAGMNLDLQTFPWSLETREDEGELALISEHFVYPWEALGRYDPGQWTQEFDDKEVQYTKMKGKVDLADGDEDLQGMSRYTEYGGYLGQGHLRILSVPTKTTGKRHFADKNADEALFVESIGLDGSYFLASARQNAFVKRVMIPNPKRVRLPEDQKDGEDARKDNYKFSSRFGSGEDHKVGDVVVSDQGHLLRAAGVLDLLAYAVNWKAVHPFHYHKKDFDLPQPGATAQTFTAVQDKLDFSGLGSSTFMEYPTATRLKVDDRYGTVDDFQRESWIVQHEDGSVTIGCGYGNQIRLGPEGIVLESPADIQLHGARRVLNLSDQIILRAKGSVDVSSTEKDVRIKAHENLQMVSAEGGIFLESKSSRITQTYEDAYGEDVRASGIVLLARKSQVGVLARDVLVQTTEGGIALDAAKGAQEISLVGRNVNAFVAAAVNIWISSSLSSDAPTWVHSHQFGENQSKIDGRLLVEKGLYCGDEVRVDGAIRAKGDIVSLSNLLQRGTPRVPGDSSLQDQVLRAALTADSQARDYHLDSGKIVWEGQVSVPWRSYGHLGNDKLQEQIGFSFRDPLTGNGQYKTSDFKLLEPRWQQMVRLDMASGGSEWTEKPVHYQNKDTYPFPGEEKLKGSILLRYDKHTMFDADKRRDQDRATPYETPKLGNLVPATLDGTYKLVSSSSY